MTPDSFMILVEKISWLTLVVIFIAYNHVAITVSTAIFTIRCSIEPKPTDAECSYARPWGGTYLAYYPMIIGTWACIALLFTSAASATLLKLLLAMIVASELLRIGSHIRSSWDH